MMRQSFAKGVSGQRFRWRAPEPNTGTLTATWDGSALTLAAVHADITVTTSASDGRLLTADGGAPASMAGLEGVPWGECFLVLDEGGVREVVLHRVDGASLYLADAWEQSPYASGGTLHFRWYTGTLSAARVASVERGIEWTVQYTTSDGDAPADVRRVHGLADVVLDPYVTGCTDADVLAVLPMSGPTPHRRQQGYGPQIAIAGAQLRARLRYLLASRALDEHDVFAPDVLRIAHAMLAAAVVLQQNAPESAEALRVDVLGPRNPTTGRRMGGDLEDLVAAIALDKDRDGTVDAGEDRAALSGTSLRHPTLFQDREDTTATKRRFTTESGW